MNDIKPCPFCGSTKISFSAFSFSEDAYVKCESCNAGIEIQVPWGNMGVTDHDKVCAERLTEVWDRRSEAE
ncbi:Lar family restriction alleviation protein [Enterococcus larvae]|uniref:Lar family restriction alleviation protein n=1 Tax=Enterococcus larvae TaxID=2794352 RepID=UPI003F38489E